MQCGDGKYTPDTAVYKIIMGLAAFLDSVIDTQPFTDVRKILKGYSISQFTQPMLFNNYVPDNNAEFDFTRMPDPRFQTPELKSHAGDYIMTVLSILAIPLAVLSPLAAITALPAAVIKKKKKLKASPPAPERY